MENKCKNKKCQRLLPKGYKYKYCESCRNEQAQRVKRFGEGALGLAAIVGGIAIATTGKNDPKDKA